MVQDGGRHNYQSYGIPTSGFMDKYSASIANLLVGNDPLQSIIEMNFVGAEIKAQGDIYIAITGADMQATIDGKSVAMYETAYVKDGSILKFKNAHQGARTYLAIAGKLDAARWLTSSSTYSSIKISSLQDNLLLKGMKISVENKSMIAKKYCPDKFRLKESQKIPIRVLAGPEYKWFDKSVIDYLQQSKFTVDTKSNRMAITLAEKLPNYKPKQELISSGTIPGTIQISNDGTPIILMREGGTTGGYPRIAKVLDTDINRLAQLSLGQSFNFEFISYKEAEDISRQEEENWQKLLKQLSKKQ